MEIYSFSKRDYSLITLLIILGIGVAVLEGLGIAVFFPILQSGQGLGMIDLPYPFNKVFEYFAKYTITQRIQIVAVLLAIITCVRVYFLYLTIRISLDIRSLVISQVKMRSIKQLMNFGMGYFNKRKASEFYVLYDNHIELALGTVVELLCNNVPSLITTPFLVVFLFVFSWKITLASLFLVIFASLIFHFLAAAIKRSGDAYVASKESFNKILLDIIHGMKILHLFNAEKIMSQSFEKEVNSFNNTYNKMSELTKIVGPLYEITGTIVLAIILILASFFIPLTNNESFITILLTFLLVLVRLIPRLKQINHAWGAILSRIPALEELKKFLSPVNKIYIPDGHVEFGGLKQTIEFKGVDFGYNPQQTMVLKNVSFCMEKGMKVGIVGPSGSGKSTVVELLLRFYDPQKGNILIDGVDLRELTINSWRKYIGVVSQDAFLFHDSIKGNIAFANPQVSLDQIRKAAYRAHADEFIEKMPLAYDTVIGDRGVLLSGGQRQRIAIARAILMEPEILIFDEATSALDTESEKTVQEAMDEVAQGKTVITIAHRISTIMNSDKIIVVADGRVVEQGSPAELLKQDGIYKRFVQNQTINF